jgi:predicted transcriptional regulator
VRRPTYHKLLQASPKVEKYLGALETEIMELLWQRQPLTVREVLTELSTTRPLAYTTVMTVMSRLAGKGLLRQTREQKTFSYAPAVTRDQLLGQVSRDIVRDLLRDFGEVAVAQFVAEVSAQDVAALDRLEQLLKEARQQG